VHAIIIVEEFTKEVVLKVEFTRVSSFSTSSSKIQ